MAWTLALGCAAGAGGGDKGSKTLGGRWEKRQNSEGDSIAVRRLRDAEIPEWLHREKPRLGMGPRDSFYIDGDGNVYYGGSNTPLEEYGPVEGITP